MNIIIFLNIFLSLILLIAIYAALKYKDIGFSYHHMFEKFHELSGAIEFRLKNPLKYFSDTNTDTTWMIICTINRKQYIKQLVEQFNEYEPGINLIVIDNGSTDGSQQLLLDLYKEKKINKFLLNQPGDSPQWQKAYAIHQAFNVLSTEDISYVGWIDDDIEINGSFLEFAKKALNFLENKKDVVALNLFLDDKQSDIHKPIDVIDFENKRIKIIETLNGAFVFMKASFFKEFGLPPIKEGINYASVEDWYYTRLIQSQNKKVGAINFAEHLAYNNSQRSRSGGKGIKT